MHLIGWYDTLFRLWSTAAENYGWAFSLWLIVILNHNSQLQDHEFTDNYIATIGIDFVSTTLQAINGRLFSLVNEATFFIGQPKFSGALLGGERSFSTEHISILRVRTFSRKMCHPCLCQTCVYRGTVVKMDVCHLNYRLLRLFMAINQRLAR